MATSAMVEARRMACGLYLVGAIALFVALTLRAESAPRPEPFRAIDRARARGEVDDVPRLDRKDAMANAAVLSDAIAAVPVPGRTGASGQRCEAAPRFFALLRDGKLSRVRFNARQVCQLKLLKRVSVAQPGFGERGLGEVAAFVLGRRVPGGEDVDVSRVVVPPFRLGKNTLSFFPADLGPLAPGEQFIGTYHTHPEGDLEEGTPSDVDLRFMMNGRADFHGRVGRLHDASADDVDWLFDIVEPRDGDWNVYAHDWKRLEEIAATCTDAASCPLDQLRITGSRYYLLTRYYEEKQD